MTHQTPRKLQTSDIMPINQANYDSFPLKYNLMNFELNNFDTFYVCQIELFLIDFNSMLKLRVKDA